MNKMNLTEEQWTAVRETERNLQIVACAGSGKTEVISRRIAGILENKPEIRPEAIVAFTFTEKAADSLTERIRRSLPERMKYAADRMYIGTIHGFCRHLLAKYNAEFADFHILDTVKRDLFVNRYHAECGMDTLKMKLYPQNVRLFLTCIDKMVDDYANQENWLPEHRIAFQQYRDCLYGHHFLDFSLMILEALRQMEQNPEVDRYLKSIRYLVVDEYQDVDDLQEKLISMIASSGANICVVGDDDQTIYQFRGSNADNMITFPKRYENVHTVHLDRNFRCGTEVVEIADCIIRNNQNRISKQMRSGSEKHADVIAVRYESPANQQRGIVDLITDAAAAGIPYHEIAILVRKGKHIAPIVAELERCGIPCLSNSSESFFGSSYVQKLGSTIQILPELNQRALNDIWSDVLPASAITSGFRTLRRMAREGRGTLADIVQSFCDAAAFLNESNDDIAERKTAADGICYILNDYEEIYGDWQLSARISGVMQFLDKQVDEEYKYHDFGTSSCEDAVHVMTVHKSKGLEFEMVILPELEKREFPVAPRGGKQFWHVLGGSFAENKDKYQSDTDDERKLFYVAVTRAKQKLCFTYELSRQQISQFVIEAAECSGLKINREDLQYNPKEDSQEPFGICEDSDTAASETAQEREAERAAMQEYWAMVKYARGQLYDYYGTAGHFFPAARAELGRIKTLTPDEILGEAQRLGLI